jgi:alpha-methylacyl-CoA racemase
MREAAQHPHLVQRATFFESDGVTQPAPAPRFSRTPSAIPRPPVAAGTDTDAVLAEFGFDAAEIASLRATGAIG